MAQGVANQFGGNIDLIKNTASEADLTKRSDLLKGQEAYRQAVENLRREVAKAQEGETSGLAKIKEAHDERIRQLTEEGHLTTQTSKMVDQISEAETKRFQLEQSRLDAQAKVTASRSVEEANLRAGYDTFQAQRRTHQYGQTDIDAEYDNAMKLATLQHATAIDNLANLKEEDRDRAKLVADTQLEVAGIDAKAKKEAETIRYLQEQDLLRRKAHMEEVDHQQKMMDLATTSNERIARDAMQHQTRMHDILMPLGGSSLGREIQGVKSDYSAMYTTAMTAAAEKEADYTSKLATDRAELANAVQDDKESWQKKIDALEDEHLKNVEASRKEIDDLRYAAQQKIAELEMKQFEEIKSKTEGLLNTAINNPKKFGKQLETTLKDAAFHPIEDKISTGISTEIYKLLHHGATPGSKLADLKVGTVDDSLKVHVTNLGGGSGGSAAAPGSVEASMRTLMGAPAFGRMLPNFSMAGMGGGSLPSFNMPSFGGGNPTMEGTSESIDFGGGAQDLGGSVRSLSPGGSGGLAGLFGKVLGSAKGGLSGLKGSLGGLTRSPVTTDDQGNTTGGKITGANGMLGAALGAGGMYLAQRGLLGNDRGTGAGIAEGTAGGAALGFEYGGPLGALIGGLAGAGIGIGEKLAGVESPRNEVKRLVKQHYGMSINNNTADSIVDIATKKYASNYTVAVMSPEVRQMLMLTAAASGQKMPVGSTTPHAASFSEQGGQLSQEATYIYGQAFTYQSNVPVAGNIPTQTYSPGTSGPISLQLAVNGQGAGAFMAGSVVTPDFVQSQWSSAQASSNGRLQNAATMQYPGLVV
jgi:hypothetical protein